MAHSFEVDIVHQFQKDVYAIETVLLYKTTTDPTLIKQLGIILIERGQILQEASQIQKLPYQIKQVLKAIDIIPTVDGELDIVYSGPRISNADLDQIFNEHYLPNWRVFLHPVGRQIVFGKHHNRQVN